MTESAVGFLWIEQACSKHGAYYSGPAEGSLPGCPKCPPPPKAVYLTKTRRVATAGLSKEEQAFVEAANKGNG
jgi:hypothetical protein